MRPRIGLLLLVLLASAMTACGPGEVTTTTPPPPPTTPTPTPSPQWTPEEQAAMDAAQRYIEVWADIGQHLPNTDQNRILDVAGDPLKTQVVLHWAEWIESGRHQVGTPTFIPNMVQPGAHDHQGDRYHVYGCYDSSATYLVESDGKIVTYGKFDHIIVRFLVLHLTNSSYIVVDESSEDKPC